MDDFLLLQLWWRFEVIHRLPLIKHIDEKSITIYINYMN